MRPWHPWTAIDYILFVVMGRFVCGMLHISWSGIFKVFGYE